MIIRTLTILALSLLCSDCTHANEKTCGAALIEIKSIFGNVARSNTSEDSVKTQVEHAISTAKESCDVTDMETGISIAHAKVMLGDYEDAINIFRGIAPKDEAEDVLKYFELAHLYITLNEETLASETATEMRDKYPGNRLTLFILTEHTCTFKRCATALDGAKYLEQNDPTDLAVQLLLAFAYADRHDFENAADKFEIFMPRDKIWRLNSKYALIGVASFSNARRKDRALELYSQFSQLKPPRSEQERTHHELMKKIAEDKTDEIYLFSEWPIK